MTELLEERFVRPKAASAAGADVADRRLSMPGSNIGSKWQAR